MKGRQPGKPTNHVTATLNGTVRVGKLGVTFEVWDKWKKKRRKLGTMTVSVGGLRWWPNNGRKDRGMRLAKIARLFEASVTA
jgi:hypothetical protein